MDTQTDMCKTFTYPLLSVVINKETEAKAKGFLESLCSDFSLALVDHFGIAAI